MLAPRDQLVPFFNDMSDETTRIVLSVLFGGISGALVSSFNNRRIEKEKRALEFVKDYFAMRDKIGKAKGYLDKVDVMLQNPVEAMTLIREVGDRLNSIAYYYMKKILRRDLLNESGVLTDINEFLQLVDKAQVELRQKDAKEHPAVGICNLDKVGKWWPHLFNLRAFQLNQEKLDELRT